MQLKKSVLFSIGDIQEAITLIAKGHGVIARNLTQSELKEIVENGSMSIDMEYIETKGSVLNNDEIFPFQFFIDMCGRVQGLSVFLKNLEQEVLYKHFSQIIESKKEIDLILDYYKKKTSKFPELGPKEIYGENWREKWDHLGKIYVSIGQKFLIALQNELRKPDTNLKGINGFSKDFIIQNIYELGFSGRVSSGLNWIKYKKEPIGNHIGKKMLPEIYRLRNLGKKSIKEIEDFILLYDL